MRETQKRILGFSGLALVTSMTLVAANVHIPGALAMSAGVTDTLTVRVVGAEPALRITSPENGASYTDPNGHTLTYTYEHAVSTSLVYAYYNPQGEKIFENRVLDSLTDLDYNAGTREVALNFGAGYGTYVYTLNGIGFDDVQAASDAITIYYRDPHVTPPDEGGDDTDEPAVDPEIGDSNVEINLGDTTSTNPNATSYQIEVKDPSGNVVYTITVKPDTDKFVLPLGDLDAPTSGTNYTIDVTPLDSNGNALSGGQTIQMDPDEVADPQAPALEDDGSVSVDLGVNTNQVDEAIINVTDPNNPNFNYTVVIPTQNPSGSSTINVTLINNVTGERTEVTIPAPDPATGRITIPFGAMGAESNTNYTLTITTRQNGQDLFTTVSTLTYPTYLPVPNAGAPDTGALFKDLNISKEDYLISGLIVFFVLSVVAIGIIARKGKKSRR